MKQGRRFGFSEEQKLDVWRCWKAGQTLHEREEISRGLASGSSIREIAKCLERAVSTVSREVARHGGRPAYRASQAEGEAWQSALRPKRCLLSINVKLRGIVASKLIALCHADQSTQPRYGGSGGGIE